MKAGLLQQSSLRSQVAGLSKPNSHTKVFSRSPKATKIMAQVSFRVILPSQITEHSNVDQRSKSAHPAFHHMHLQAKSRVTLMPNRTGSGYESLQQLSKSNSSCLTALRLAPAEDAVLPPGIPNY